MAEWSNATMTDVGADLQAKVNAGKTKLTFTKIKVGSGVNATNPLALTDVISSKWETTNFVVKQEGKIVSVDTFITNNGITEAFRMSEIGLFAQDPDKGEVLYAYLTDPEPDRMPAEGGSVVVSQELTIGMVFSNTGNVSLTVNMGALVTHEQLEQHNADATAHDNRFNAIIQQLNNMITSVDNRDSLAKAPTLQLVKTLLSSLNIKNATDVVNALESEKATGLGIRYDFSNVNAWYICLGKLFGNLIIQGGRKLNLTIYDGRKYDVQFPISYAKECIGVLQTLEWPIAIGGASVAYTDKRTTTGYTIVADASSAAYNSDLFYVSFGI